VSENTTDDRDIPAEEESCPIDTCGVIVDTTGVCGCGGVGIGGAA
jgi:hypothetical protein